MELSETYRGAVGSLYGSCQSPANGITDGHSGNVGVQLRVSEGL